MYLDKAPMPSAELAERIQRLDDTRALRPAASHTAGERNHRHAALGERLHAGFAMPAVADVGLGVLDLTGDGQSILRQPDAPRTKVALDLLVLRAVEAIAVEQFVQCARRAACAGRRSRHQPIEQL